MNEPSWFVVSPALMPVSTFNIIIETNNGVKVSTPVTYEELEDIRRRRQAGEDVEDDINRVTDLMTDLVIQLVNKGDIDNSKEQVNKWIIDAVRVE